MTPRHRVHQILRSTQRRDPLSFLVGVALPVLIGLSIVALVLETVKEVHDAAPTVFLGFEIVTVIVFTAEYLLRLWTCVEDHRYRRPVLGRLRWATSPMALVDLFAFAYFYVPFLGLDLRFARALRLLRLLRLGKLSRYSKALQLAGRVARSKAPELVAAVMLLGLSLLISASLMYYAEREAQPEVFSSIPAAMWWGIATLSTVGYGDVYPVTPLGKLLGSFVAVVGIGIFALPTGILGAAYVEELQRGREAKLTRKACPHCGKHADEAATPE